FPAPGYYAAKAAVMAGLALTGKKSGAVMTNPRALFAPADPYRPNAKRPWRRGQSTVGELPVAGTPGLRLPALRTHPLPLPPPPDAAPRRVAGEHAGAAALHPRAPRHRSLRCRRGRHPRRAGRAPARPARDPRGEAARPRGDPRSTGAGVSIRPPARGRAGGA